MEEISELDTIKKSIFPLTVLVADDIDENLELLNLLLQENNYIALNAHDGNEALEIIEKNSVHLIIADAMMPKVDGFQLCKQLRKNEHTARIPLIMYTGNYVDAEDEELAKQIGVNKYLMKTGGMGPLIIALNELALQFYGFNPDVTEQDVSPFVETIDDDKFLHQHHSLVSKKLEEKMKELQLYAEKLTKKNRELFQSELRYRSLFEYARIAIVILSSNTQKIIDLNLQAATLLQYERSEIIDLDALPFIEPVEFKALMELAKKDNPLEIAMKTKDGSTILVEITAGPISHLDEMHLMLFIRDVTEQKRMRENLLQVEKMSLMGKLAAGIAHEIRNPLAGLAMNLLFLKRRTAVNSPELESIEAAIDGSQRIQHIIEDTLSLARVTPPTLREEFVNEMIRRSLTFISSALQHKNIIVVTDYEPSSPCVLVDFKQIQQVLLNLLQNAIDASPEHRKIHIESKIILKDEVLGEPQKSFVQISIIDEGSGLTKDMWQHLFEPFKTTKPTGTGLGLMLSKYILERHQGFILFEPGVEAGTIVRVQLPQHIFTV